MQKYCSAAKQVRMLLVFSVFEKSRQEMCLVNVSFFLAMLVSKVTAALWQSRLWYADHLMETTLALLNALPIYISNFDP